MQLEKKSEACKKAYFCSQRPLILTFAIIYCRYTSGIRVPTSAHILLQWHRYKGQTSSTISGVFLGSGRGKKPGNTRNKFTISSTSIFYALQDLARGGTPSRIGSHTSRGMRSHRYELRCFGKGLANFTPRGFFDMRGCSTTRTISIFSPILLSKYILVVVVVWLGCGTRRRSRSLYFPAPFTTAKSAKLE